MTDSRAAAVRESGISPRNRSVADTGPDMRDGELLAAVDLGSNSFHLVVARYEHGGLRLIDRLREHAPVEFEQPELAVEEVRRRQVLLDHRETRRECDESGTPAYTTNIAAS